MQRVIEQLALDVTAGRRLAGSVYARSALAKGAFASKMFHTFKMQAPCAAIRTTVLRNIQKVINQLVFGKFFQIRTDTAQQPYKDGGVSHLHVERRMKAEWAMLAAQLATNEPAPWKNIWWYGMRDVYGPLCDDPDLVHTTCQFKLLPSSKEPSQVQQLAIAAWAELEKIPVFLGPPPTTPAGRKRRADALALAQYDGDESPPVTMPIWQEGLRGDITGARVGRQRLWFNASLVGRSQSHIHTPCHTHDAATNEREAIQWAEEGLVRFADVTQGTKLQGIRTFRTQFPDLDPDVYLGIRTSIPSQWERAMKDGTAAQWGQDRLPTDLLDDGVRADSTNAHATAATRHRKASSRLVLLSTRRRVQRAPVQLDTLPAADRRVHRE